MDSQNDLFKNEELLDQIFESNNFSDLKKWVNENNQKIYENKKLCLKIISKSIAIMEGQKREINQKNIEINVRDKMIKELNITQNEYDKNTLITIGSLEKSYNDKMMKMADDVTTKIDEIKKDFDDKLEKNNENWNTKFSEQKMNLIILGINLKVENFRRNVEALINYKRHYFTNLKIECLEKEIELNEIDKNKLTALYNDFYSFRNIAVYRKIINVLLKKIIDLNLNNLKIENKNNMKYIKADKKFENYNDLNNIINFFFFFKKKSSLILHFLEDVEGLIKKLNKQEPFKLQIIENMKGTEDFLKNIKENCSYQKLINTLNIDRPLLFYDEIDNSKEKVEGKIKSILISLNKNLEKEFVNNYNELFEELKNQAKTIIDLIDKNRCSINDFKEFDIEFKKLKNEEDSFKEIKKLEKENEELFISFTQVISNKKESKKMFFTMVDFIGLYKKDFRPFEICSKLFDDSTKKEKLDFMDDDVKDFVEYLENKKNSLH